MVRPPMRRRREGPADWPGRATLEGSRSGARGLRTPRGLAWEVTQGLAGQGSVAGNAFIRPTIPPVFPVVTSTDPSPAGSTRLRRATLGRVDRLVGWDAVLAQAREDRQAAKEAASTTTPGRI